MTYEMLKHDMNAALKAGDKLRRLTLADIIATIDKTAMAGKNRVEITSTFVDEVLLKYKKTIQEMIDTCPKTDAYAATLSEYMEKYKIIIEYAPVVVDKEDEINKIIDIFSIENGIEFIPANRSNIMKQLMPYLKSKHCDMKIANQVITNKFK